MEKMAVSALMEITHFLHNLLVHGTGSSCCPGTCMETKGGWKTV